jgi:MFS family permease
MRPGLRPLTTPAFRRLAAARVVDELGDWLGEIALAVLVFDRTGSPMATAGLFLALQFAPALATPPLVARIEPYRSRVSLSAINVLLALVFVLLALLSRSFSLAAVLVLAGLAGALAVSARSLSRAAAAAVLAPHGLLREGNALLNIAFTTGAAAGPAIGGLVVAGAGTQAALLADAGSFAVVALLLATAAGLPPAREEGSGWRERLRLALRYVAARPQLRTLIGAQAVAFAFFAVVIPIEVVFAKGTLHAGSAGYGALLASWGGGMIAGALIFARAHGRSIVATLGFSTIAIGAAYLGVAVSPTLAVACAASAVGGAGNGVQWVALLTALQEATPASMLARTMALFESIGTVMPGVGFVLGGVVAAVVSARAAYAIAGAGVLLLVLTALVSRPQLEPRRGRAPRLAPDSR